MKWAIKHKSGRTLFVTSDEFVANNRREMGWIVEKVEMTQEEFEKWIGNPYMLDKRVNPALYLNSKKLSDWEEKEIQDWERNPYDHPYTRGAYDMLKELNK